MVNYEPHLYEQLNAVSCKTPLVSLPNHSMRRWANAL